MDDKEIAREIRKRKSYVRIHTKRPQCALCPETDPDCFEGHHLAGRRYDDTLVLLCKNCHAKATNLQKDHPKPVAEEPDYHERCGHILLGIADLLHLLVKILSEMGEMLIQKVSNG